MTAHEQYTDDAPISRKEQDRFSRWPFAERIAHVLATRSDPSSLVVGIYGPWGDGKTSVVNMMAEVLAAESNVICVSFNPWHFEDESHLIRAFFDTLADALGKTLTTKKEELGKFLQQYGGLLSLASFTVAGGLAEVNPGAAATGMGEALSSVGLEEVKARVSKVLVESGKRVIVLVDDIDRLDRAEIHTLLKLIKLSASFSNTAYVVAFDDEVVAASLGERYGAGGIEAGRHFLEKIIQVPLNLPDAEGTDLRALCFEGINEVLSENQVDLTEDDAEAFAMHFTRGIMPALRTPRQVKRYLNAITFAVPLLKGEVHLSDQLLIEALRTTYPRLYLTIRENPDVFTGEATVGGYGKDEEHKKEARAKVDASLTGFSNAEHEAATDLIKALFPRMNAVFGGSTYGSDWNKPWTEQKRITSAGYVRRYFQYSVPARDVPDEMVNAVIADANATGTTIDTFVQSVSARAAWSRALDKLFSGRKDLNDSGRKALAVSLAKSAAKIPAERGMFSSILSSRSRAAALVSDLIAEIPNSTIRSAVSIEVMQQADSLAFAADCLRWLSKAGREESETPPLDEAAFATTGGVLAARIAVDMTSNLDYARHGRDLGRLLWIWKTSGPVGEMETFFAKRFEDDPNDAVRFLNVFIGRGWSLESGISHAITFDRGNFDNVASLVEPEMILNALKKTHGPVLENVNFEKCYELKGDQRTAGLFVAIYQKVQEEKAAASEAGKAEPAQEQ